MRIASIRTRVVTVPIKRPVVARIGHYSHMWFVLVDVAADDGLSGLAYLWTFSDHGARAVQNVIAELAEIAVREDPFFTTRLWRVARQLDLPPT